MQTPDIQTKESLLEENRQLRARLEEVEETLRAIRSGEVDALVVSTPEGEQIFTLKGALDPYRAMVEAMSEGAVTFTLDGFIVYCNLRFAELLKTPLEQVIGTELQRYVAPDERRRFEALLAQSKETPLRREIGLLAADGTIVPVQFSTRSLKEGFLWDIAAVVTDLSAVAAAAEARSRLALLVESSNDAIISVDLDGVVDSWNAAAEQIFGYTAAEAIGQTLLRLVVPPERAGEVARILDTIGRGERTGHMETVRLRKDGTPIDVSVTVSPIKDATGRITGASAITRDISERKRAEEALRQSHERLRMIAETIQDVFWISTPGVKEMVYISPAYERTWERSCESLYRAPQTFLDALHPDDRAVLLETVDEFHAKGKAYEIEYRIVRRNGEVRWMRERGFPVQGAGGHVKYMTGVVSDITELKKAQEELEQHRKHLEVLVRERTAKLEAANKDLENFAYSVSHDLRAPLRAVDGFSRILIKHCEGKLDDEGARLLNIVRDSANRMSLMIDGILAYSRAGRFEMTMREIDMDTLVREVFDELKPGFAGRELNMEIRPLPRCHGDHTKLREVWANLLSNAIKFTRPRAAASVEVGGHLEGAEIIYYVKDNGAGFDMRYADKLFGVFQRMHGMEEFEGSGIGLAIVKRIVTRHGGRVWAVGKVEQGATFYFTLPIQEPGK